MDGRVGGSRLPVELRGLYYDPGIRARSDSRRRLATAQTTALVLESRPQPTSRWLGAVWSHRSVLVALAAKDFRVRYKRTVLGILWSVLLPLFQSLVLVVVFSRVGQFGSGDRFSYAGYVIAGMVPWVYLSMSVNSSTTAIVDGAALTDKVWFPRALLVLVPPVANLSTLALSELFLLCALPVLGTPMRPRLLMIVPASILLIAFTASLGLVLGAMYVYFRDVKFMVGALLTVWLYITPIVYTPPSLRRLGHLLAFNPITGIVQVFQWAAVGAPYLSVRALVVTLVTLGVLTVAGVWAHRRFDRLFVDLL